MTPKELKQYATLDQDSIRMLLHASEKLHLSARAVHRVIKVARTIADLDGVESVTSAAVAEALQYRQNCGKTSC